MYSSVKNDLLDGIIKNACLEYLSRELAKLPSEEELASQYPISKKSYRKAKRRYRSRKLGLPISVIYLKRVAVFILALISVTFALLNMSETVRAAISDTVTEWYDKYIKIQFFGTEDNRDFKLKDADQLNVGYIPEGFELVGVSKENGFREYTYYTENGDYLIIGIYASEYVGVLADNELSEYQETVINGNTACFSYNENEKYGILTAGNSKYTVSVMGGRADRDEFIKIAENIK